jgi:putative transcriptional regulator
MFSITLVFLYAGADAFLLPERSLTARFTPTTTTVTSPVTSCFMSKNSDRAHIERNLEDMMNNDWRVFRASLVAQERAEKTDGGNSASHHGTGSDGLQKQGQLSDMFAGAINNIFRNKSNSDAKKENIFAGDSVGGATTLPGDDDNDNNDNDDALFVFEDPFVSAEELPLLLKPTVRINKHRWAHAISNVEPGCVLVANEKLGGVFHQTVVLIIEHHQSSGSIGVVINR